MIYPSLAEFRKKAKFGNLVPVYKEILADIETPVSAFLKFDTSKFGFLLESVEGGEKIARYSFLGAEPALIFRSKGNKVELLENDKLLEQQEVSDPLEALKSVLKRYKPVIDPNLPRFIGGAVGYLGYDIVRFIEKIPDKNPDELNLPDAYFLITDSILIFDHVKHKLILVANAFVENNQVDLAYYKAVDKINQLEATIMAPLQIPIRKTFYKPSPETRSNFSKEDFISIVKKAKEYISAGEIIQVVLAQRWQKETSAPPFNIYRALRSVNPSPYMFYLKFDNLYIIGASPELLVRLEDKIIETRPIAGTRRRGKNDEEDAELIKDLLADPKERAEHIMLVDLGRNDIGKVAKIGSVKVTELMVIEKYSHVMHIVSNVEGELADGYDAFDVLRACFPAGTVTGAPKIRAMEIIDELENTKRSCYAGAVGYISFSGNLDTCITIRTIIVKNNLAYVYSGAGIVADSDPEKEYQETVNKAQASLHALDIAESI